MKSLFKLKASKYLPITAYALYRDGVLMGTDLEVWVEVPLPIAGLPNDTLIKRDWFKIVLGAEPGPLTYADDERDLGDALSRLASLETEILRSTEGRRTRRNRCSRLGRVQGYRERWPPLVEGEKAARGSVGLVARRGGNTDCPGVECGGIGDE